MKDKYIMAMLLGTQDSATDEYPYIPLYVKASDVSDLPSFEKQDISGIAETQEEEYITAGLMAVFDPETKEFKPIQLYAVYKEWLDLTIIASEHITGNGKDGAADEGN